jgi:hypothetical protein
MELMIVDVRLEALDIFWRWSLLNMVRFLLSSSDITKKRKEISIANQQTQATKS